MSRRKKKLEDISIIPDSSAKKSNKIISFFTQGFDLRALLQIIAIIVALIIGSIAIKNFNSREQSEKSQIILQMGIQPTNQVDKFGRHYFYESWYMFTNKGQATVKTANITWFLNNKYIQYNSKPYLIGPEHGAEIIITETTTPGYCEFNVKNLPPNVGFLIGVKHKIKETFADELFITWQKNMFDKKFTNYFLSEVIISGEKVSIKNEGAYDLPNMTNK